MKIKWNFHRGGDVINNPCMGRVGRVWMISGSLVHLIKTTSSHVVPFLRPVQGECKYKVVRFYIKFMLLSFSDLIIIILK